MEVKRKHEFDQCQVRQDILSIFNRISYLSSLSSTGYPIYPLNNRISYLSSLSSTGYPIYPLNNRISYLSSQQQYILSPSQLQDILFILSINGYLSFQQQDILFILCTDISLHFVYSTTFGLWFIIAQGFWLIWYSFNHLEIRYKDVNR